MKTPSFNHNLALLIPYNQQIDQFWHKFDSQVEPIVDLIINTITDLINQQQTTIEIPPTKELTYNQLIKTYQSDLLNYTNYEPVAIIDVRIEYLNRIINATDTNVTLNQFVNAILRFITKASNSNQLTISSTLQTNLLQSATKIMHIDCMKVKYDAMQRKFVKR